MQFSKDQQPIKNGRPKGSRNVKSQFSAAMTKTALEQLQAALDKGEQFAIDLVLKRTHPLMKPVTPVDSLDGKILQAKLLEMTELEQRIKALEANA